MSDFIQFTLTSVAQSLCPSLSTEILKQQYCLVCHFPFLKIKAKGYNNLWVEEVPGIKPQVTSGKLLDSPSNLPCICLWIKGGISYYIRCHSGPYSTHPFSYSSVQSMLDLWMSHCYRSSNVRYRSLIPCKVKYRYYWRTTINSCKLSFPEYCSQLNLYN